MLGKSQTIGDFTVSRPFQTSPTNENWKMEDIPYRLGWTKTDRENWDCFYFHEVSQISAMVGDHARHMKTQICTIGDVGESFSCEILHRLGFSRHNQA